MGMLSIFSFIGFTLLGAIIAWYVTGSINKKSADGYFLRGRSLGEINKRIRTFDVPVSGMICVNSK